MISARRLGVFTQHVLLFTGLGFTAASANAFFLSGAESIELTKAAFSGYLLKAFCVGSLIAVVLLGRDSHLNRKNKNA